MSRWLLLLLLAPALASAEDPREEELSLSVKPVLCIVDTRSKRCDFAFLVRWQSKLDGYYCLFSDLADTPLRCWTDRRDGEHNDERVVDETFTYWMTGDDISVRLATKTVEVLRLDSDDRRRKRRTRHVWDIN